MLNGTKLSVKFQLIEICEFIAGTFIPVYLNAKVLSRRFPKRDKLFIEL